ncbi:MAG: DsrE/DsrF/DrsH-like family protein [Marinilabiliales bacterium]|nr:DsrE/DsrF/DrsH-like family protein [Marinilabiliales bacterium]
MNKLHTGTLLVTQQCECQVRAYPSLLFWAFCQQVLKLVSSAMMRGQMEKNLIFQELDEFLDMITAGGGEIYACKFAVDMFKLKKEDLSDHVIDIITIGDFYNMAGGEGSQIIFT